ncbi:hypothetical protein K443DRAFT_80480, partial [Laccaria amethystina LaAM-08-1]
NLSLHYRFPTGALLVLDRLLTRSGFRQLNSIGFHINGCAPPKWIKGYDFKEATETVIREEFVSLSQSGVRTLDTSVTLQ